MNASLASRAAGPRFKLALLMLSGSVGCVLGAGAANATVIDGAAPTQVVRYSAASLATDGGVQQLYRRILYAAKQVCPEESLDLTAHSLTATCRAQAVARAIQQIGNTRLAALYASSSSG
jgi:UrcA family protein